MCWLKPPHDLAVFLKVNLCLSLHGQIYIAYSVFRSFLKRFPLTLKSLNIKKINKSLSGKNPLPTLSVSKQQNYACLLTFGEDWDRLCTLSWVNLFFLPFCSPSLTILCFNIAKLKIYYVLFYIFFQFCCQTT